MSDGTGFLARVWRSGAIGLVARLAVGGTFMVLAWNKIQQPGDFLKVVREYHLIPVEWPLLLNFTAAVLPWLELLCGLLLVLGVGVRGTALLMLTLLLIFSSAILLRTLDIHAEQNLPFSVIEFDCGCGSGVELAYLKLIENTLLIVASVIALFSSTCTLCLRGRFLARA